MIDFPNTDLALEKYDFEELRGSEFIREEINGFTVCTLDISDMELSSNYKREIGKYTSIFCPPLWQMDKLYIDMLSYTVAGVLERIIGTTIQNSIDDLSLLVVGLGNSEVSADSLGPLTSKRLTVTRHLRKFLDCENAAAVSTIIPGVLSQTGIETLETVKGVVEKVAPDIVIAIDSLAASECESLGAVIQVSNSGISPGSGIGNYRKGINKETIGRPVITLGIPTVVDVSTFFRNFSNGEKTSLPKSFFVSPKEIDRIADIGAEVCSRALDIVFGFYS